jgi:YidC/Oxa1 family membrane protein insertase
MILASALDEIPHLIVVAFAWILAGFYSLVPNYALAIALLTVSVMVVTFPLTRAGTRSMMKQQLIAPEVKKLQQRFKAPPGTPPAERRELQMQMSEELNALYRENGVSMAGGCLLTFLPMPFFFVLYSVVRGLTATVKVGTGAAARTLARPIDLAKTTELYKALLATNGRMESFGIDLSLTVRSPHHGWVGAIPYAVVVLIAVGLQYVQMKQLSGRNKAMAQANPQMQTIQKLTPIIFIIFYIYVPAAVNVYFIVSSLFRIGQQEWMYRRDPDLTATLAALAERKQSDVDLAAATITPKGTARGTTLPRSASAQAASSAPASTGFFGRLLANARENAAAINNGSASLAPSPGAARRPERTAGTRRPEKGARAGAAPRRPSQPGAAARSRPSGAVPRDGSARRASPARRDGSARRDGAPAPRPRRRPAGAEPSVGAPSGERRSKPSSGQRERRTAAEVARPSRPKATTTGEHRQPGEASQPGAKKRPPRPATEPDTAPRRTDGSRNGSSTRRRRPAPATEAQATPSPVEPS